MSHFRTMTNALIAAALTVTLTLAPIPAMATSPSAGAAPVVSTRDALETAREALRRAEEAKALASGDHRHARYEREIKRLEKLIIELTERLDGLTDGEDGEDGTDGQDGTDGSGGADSSDAVAEEVQDAIDELRRTVRLLMIADSINHTGLKTFLGLGPDLAVAPPIPGVAGALRPGASIYGGLCADSDRDGTCGLGHVGLNLADGFSGGALMLRYNRRGILEYGYAVALSVDTMGAWTGAPGVAAWEGGLGGGVYGALRFFAGRKNEWYIGLIPIVEGGYVEVPDAGAGMIRFKARLVIFKKARVGDRYDPAKHDDDNDGVMDLYDVCVIEPGTVDNLGCPVEEADADTEDEDSEEEADEADTEDESNDGIEWIY